MDNKIEVLREEIRQKLANAKDLSELDKARVEYLGKKGSITALLKGMKNLSNDEKKTFGAEVNKLKAAAAKIDLGSSFGKDLTRVIKSLETQIDSISSFVCSG